MNKYMLILFEHENAYSFALDYTTSVVGKDFTPKSIQECDNTIIYQIKK